MPTTRKHSRKRSAIIDHIRLSKAHPSAETVYESLKPDFPNLSLGTVYRNISLLREEREIVSVGFVSGEERFDGDLSDHAHFICETCGEIFDLDGACAPAMSSEEAIAEKYGFSVSRRKLVYLGKCTKCKAQNG
ncbi:MAG: transcriptional repressor [Oscillospiraceae bacterium]|jgi:Fur family peroxide stress response transcriptional regulator|nr:transcriptional repressor [Oscillospiraceae bacterium]